MSVSHRNLIIIIAVVVGILVASIAGFVVYGCRKRSARLRTRLFKRAATPLSDAEFDKWRHSTKAPTYRSGGTTVYKSTGTRFETFNGDVKVPIPAPIVSVVRLDTNMYQQASRPITPPEPRRTSNEAFQSPTTSTRPLMSHSRHKSSVSLQDRPPTPHSSSPRSAWDSESPFSDSAMEVPQSPQQKEHRVHVHYPSISEASDFDFGFQGSSPRRESARRESWVHHSHTHSRTLSHGSTQLPNFSNFHLSGLGLEDWKQRDY